MNDPWEPNSVVLFFQEEDPYAGEVMMPYLVDVFSAAMASHAADRAIAKAIGVEI